MDALTAASASSENIQVLDQTCHSTTAVASMTLGADGRAFCNKNGISSWPWNWINPQDASPGDPGYQFRRINTIGDEPSFGPLDGVWTNIGFTALSALPNPGGTGYSIGNTLTLTSGTFRVAATLNVDSIIGSGVSGVTVVEPGSYSQFPDVSQGPTSVSPPGGTGCLLDTVIGFHFTWVYFTGPLSATWDVQIRSGTGPVLRTGSWSMATLV